MSTLIHANLEAYDLRTNALVEPLGIDSPSPELSWKLRFKGEGKSSRQSAYRIELFKGSAARGTAVWDSGKVTSSESYGVAVPAGKVNANDTTYTWRVMAFDEHGNATAWSKPAHLTVGKLPGYKWAAQWIGYDAERPAKPTDKLLLPAPKVLRHSFTVGKKVKRALAYTSALGAIDLHINGSRVADDLFTPGWTDYEKRVYYRTYDVTKLLTSGSNAIGAVLGDGWYSAYVGYGHNRDHYGKNPRAFVQLEIQYTDGTTETIGSSEKWKARTGPMKYSDFLMGEFYDARDELHGWDTGSYSDKDWHPVVTGAEVKKVNLEAFPGVPVLPYQTLTAKKVTHQGDKYLVNFGQNLSGYCQLKINGKKGQKIVIRHGERLNPDGTLYTTNLRGALAIDTYICKGGPETWSPRFTFHGFQYIEVSGLDHAPTKDEIQAIAISSATPSTGVLTTSDKMLNQLISNAWWTQHMNFVDIPTDCPQRDERLGWTGDAQAYIRTATLTTDVQAFFHKWNVSLDDGQRKDGQYPMVAPVKVAGDDGGPAWADAGVICPWTIYDIYGDKAQLANHYPQMKKFVDFSWGRTVNNLPPAQYHCFGDWVSINADTPHDIIFQAYLVYSTHLLSEAAKVLGHTADADFYADKCEVAKKAFRDAYVESDGKIKGHTQCGYVLAIAFDIVSGKQLEQATHWLVDDIESRGGVLSTGFVGTRDIMNALAKVNRYDIAFKLLHNTKFPSWGFTIKNGATSIWERWDGWTPEKGFQDPGMNSFAHYAFGAVVGWMKEHIGGIHNTSAGFGTVAIQPAFDPALTFSKYTYNSVRGPITCNWTRKGSSIELSVVVPPNVVAEIHLPGGKVVTANPGSTTVTTKS